MHAHAHAFVNYTCNVTNYVVNYMINSVELAGGVDSHKGPDDYTPPASAYTGMKGVPTCAHPLKRYNGLGQLPLPRGQAYISAAYSQYLKPPAFALLPGSGRCS